MSWYAKPTDGYSETGQYAKANVMEMYNVLSSLGWSNESVSAMLGNIYAESGYNPWRWESDEVPTYQEFLDWDDDEARHHGYGLFQFTPAKKYINSSVASQYASYGYNPNFADRTGSASDGASQTAYFSDTAQYSWSHNLYNYYKQTFDPIGVNIDNFYHMSYEDFKSGNGYTLAELTGAFELCYEKPGNTGAALSYSTRVEKAQYWLDILGRKMPIYFYLKLL